MFSDHFFKASITGLPLLSALVGVPQFGVLSWPLVMEPVGMSLSLCLCQSFPRCPPVDWVSKLSALISKDSLVSLPNLEEQSLVSPTLMKPPFQPSPQVSWQLTVYFPPPSSHTFSYFSWFLGYGPPVQSYLPAASTISHLTSPDQLPVSKWTSAVTLEARSAKYVRYDFM